MLDGYGLTAAALLMAQVAFNIFIVSNSPLLVSSYGEGSPTVTQNLKTASMWWGVISTITFAVLYGVIAIMIAFVQNSKAIDNVMIGLLLTSAVAAIAIATMLYINVNSMVLSAVDKSRSQIDQYGVKPNPGGNWNDYFNAYTIIMTYPAHAAVSSAVIGVIASVLLFYRRYQNVSKLLGGLRSMFG